ncbi:hypothetical protein QTP88_006354 [Uroleucon formosanum]
MASISLHFEYKSLCLKVSQMHQQLYLLVHMPRLFIERDVIHIVINEKKHSFIDAFGYSNLTAFITLFSKSIIILIGFRLEDCKLNNVVAVTISVFKKRWNTEYNIGIHVPKKDKCTFCEAFKNMQNKSEEDRINYQLHIEEKEYTNKMFMKDQDRSGQNRFLCCSFDLQKVLNTPWGNSMLLFYSRKLAYYNFSIYESKIKAGHCYLWFEVDGKGGANEICSILYDYLKSIGDKGLFQEIALYCDSCPGQNKIHFMLGMLHHFLSNSKNIKCLTINYLLPGHTYLPVDSVHACIDKNIKKKTVWAPYEWSTIIRNLRINAGLYNTIIFKHTHFLDWSAVSSAMFMKQKLMVSNNDNIRFKSIKRVEFSKQDFNVFKIAYIFKLNEDHYLNLLSVNLYSQNRLRSTTSVINISKPNQLYTSKLPI